EAPGPHRIRYAADVFREHASLRGQARQFTQVGIELVGAKGAAADAEVVLLLIGALEAAGLSSFLVGIGTAEVLRALLALAGGPDEWQGAAVSAAQGRNLVELDRLAGREDLSPELAAALQEVPRIRGGREALERCGALIDACGCAGSLSSLAETWEILEGMGVCDRVQLDFGIMRSFGYYTGMQLEAYAPGLGLALAGGGRYDGLLSAFGDPAPAAGFALGLERVMIALAEQGSTPRLEPLDALLGGGDAAAVFSAAARLRAAGWLVRVAPGVEGSALVREADSSGAVEVLVAKGDAIFRVDRAGGELSKLAEPLPEAPRSSWAARGGDAR
ncbi:MAG: ATP phosphoribosyltransferase regulatory subunit, partial [Coriobacteriia bacterium]|nr:ATP phosphoribosyltransferase regulatory subunit [Coriobacteriia bacterium]